MDEYQSQWTTTFTGRKFHFTNPQPEEISIVDIAHHLSLLCRFTGACNRFYSVCEHSIRVAALLPENCQLAGLLHDAAEAYINDISRPVKYSHNLDGTEKIITESINKKYGITHHVIIKEADNVMLATEARDLGINLVDWAKLPDPLPYPYMIVPMTSGKVERMFLRLFDKYGGHDG